MKTAKICWSLGSLLINVVIGLFIYLMVTGPKGLAERFQFVNDNWTLYSGHWRAEFLIMILVAIGAVYFAQQFKSIGWTIIAIGQFIILWTYPLMLGGYRNTPFELANMANQMAIITFNFGNLVFFSGLFLMYLKSELLQSWLRYLALTCSGIITLLFFIVCIDVLEWKDVLMAAPLVNVMYLINAYYGFKIDVHPEFKVITHKT
ncbi:MAG: hypothetical protein AAF634_07780 [Bacteroidota bacterium]